ncbi:MAG: DUF4825 domain-containing protein [Mogibacterium sp.]|nr:DUF4825 domain-containing protein [Mogibacterium sp.]
MNKENKISCEVIRDLLPSYVDGLASDDTAKLIESHVAACPECRAMLENMRAGEQAAQQPDEFDRKEIDFLRKSRKKGKRAVALGVLLTLLAAAAAVGAKQFLIGSKYVGELACDFKVDGSHMTIDAEAADSIHIIKGLDFTIEDGVAVGKVKAVLPGLYHGGGYHGEFTFDEEIKEVRIRDRIYWARGKTVSPMASDVFNAGHDYIGDASANGALLSALRMREDLGSLYSELSTESEPYVWTIVLEEDQTKYNPAYLDKRLEGYGYVLLGSVGNLSEVDFRYEFEGKTVVKKVTLDDATAFFGRDVKVCRTDAGALSELMEKAEIR